MAIWAITPGGAFLGKKIQEAHPHGVLFLGKNAGVTDPSNGHSIRPIVSLVKDLAAQFRNYDAHVFIFSTGIALRLLAPLVENKRWDPAVVLMDDQGKNIISLLSGHIGGANALTRELAMNLGGNPVITTATDVNHCPAIDTMAMDLGMAMENTHAIKCINMAFIKGEPVQLMDPDNVLPPFPDTIPIEKIHSADEFSQAPEQTKLLCSWKRESVPRETLILRPKILSVGMGCNRNTPFEIMKSFYNGTLEKNKISPLSVQQMATTDVKADEPGLIALGEDLDLSIRFYSRSDLNSVKTIQTPSKMVEKHLGVKSVCEAAAILASNQGRLILPKQKNADVTLAVALAGSTSSEPDQAM